eukprot:306196-Prymnesium_polylepis.1
MRGGAPLLHDVEAVDLEALDGHVDEVAQHARALLEGRHLQDLRPHPLAHLREKARTACVEWHATRSRVEWGWVAFSKGGLQ